MTFESFKVPRLKRFLQNRRVTCHLSRRNHLLRRCKLLEVLKKMTNWVMYWNQSLLFLTTPELVSFNINEVNSEFFLLKMQSLWTCWNCHNIYKTYIFYLILEIYYCIVKGKAYIELHNTSYLLLIKGSLSSQLMHITYMKFENSMSSCMFLNSVSFLIYISFHTSRNKP